MVIVRRLICFLRICARGRMRKYIGIVEIYKEVHVEKWKTLLFDMEMVRKQM